MARMDELDKSTTTNHHMLGCNSRTCHFARMTLRISSICLKAYPTPPTTKPPWDTLYSDVAQWLEPPSYRGRPEFDFSASLPVARPHSKFINEVKVQRFMKSMSTVRFCCKWPWSSCMAGAIRVIGISPSGKARDFDSRIRKFEPSYPSQGLRPLNFSPAYESLKRSFMNFDMRQ